MKIRTKTALVVAGEAVVAVGLCGFLLARQTERTLRLGVFERMTALREAKHHELRRLFDEYRVWDASDLPWGLYDNMNPISPTW